ncbi:MAG: DinB family protein [Gammaproteobacteria bacterium]|nr:DinB family protein [Gammaproteobacteria bacterium]
MSVTDQFILLAEYNQLMNQRQYEAVAKLSQDDLCRDTGAFFKSVLGTLNHILVGDIIWLKRFAKHPSSSETLSYIREKDNPTSLDELLFKDLERLRDEREKIDNVILNWVSNLSDASINECITYTNMAGSSFNKPFASLINHLFLHQVHHRGQISTLLSQLKIDFGETDLIEIIDECST